MVLGKLDSWAPWPKCPGPTCPGPNFPRTIDIVCPAFLLSYAMINWGFKPQEFPSEFTNSVPFLKGLKHEVLNKLRSGQNNCLKIRCTYTGSMCWKNPHTAVFWYPLTLLGTQEHACDNMMQQYVVLLFQLSY